MVYGSNVSRDRRTHPVRYAAQELTTNPVESRPNSGKKLCLQRLPTGSERGMLCTGGKRQRIGRAASTWSPNNTVFPEDF
jgi:hypothetical protein